jgi:hypothetical protein
VVANGLETGTGAYTVSGGSITIPTAAEDVHIGLPIQFAEVETLALDVAGQAIRDKRKKVGSVTLLVDGSTRAFYVGPDSSNVMPYKANPWEGTNAQIPAFTGSVEQAIVSAYNDNGRVFLQVRDPIPMTILGIMPNVELGG